MKKYYKRTIQDVLNYETGEEIIADDFFKKPLDEISIYRSELQKAIERFREPLFVCYYCKQSIRIRGGIGQPTKRKVDTLHFAHLKDSNDCIIKTDSKYTKEEINRIKYQGARESVLHKTLKNKIAECLLFNQKTIGDISSIKVEQVINNCEEKEWKKPDINAFYRNKRIAIELQLSTTWLGVITSRQKFYRNQGIFILWIFHHFNPNDDSRLLTINDVIYTNNQNAYVFDDEAYKKSLSENNLVLRCWYKVYSLEENEIYETWNNKYIKLSDLTFNNEENQLFYHDSSLQKVEIRKLFKQHKENIRIAEEERQWELQEKTKQKMEFQKSITKRQAELVNKRKHLEAITLEQKIIANKSAETNELLKNIDHYVCRIIEQLPEKHCYLQFIIDEELLKNLKDAYSKPLFEARLTMANKHKEQSDIQAKLKNIQELETLIIGGISYKKLVMSRDWDFLKENQKTIRIIKTTEVNHLFANDYLHEISNESMLNSLRNRSEIVFLMDFANKIKEYQHCLALNVELIEKCTNGENQIRTEVKIKFLNFIDSQLNDFKSKNEVQMNEINASTDEILKLENDIKFIESQFDTIDD